MLDLRPNCEWCDCDLPPDSPDARICTYECTYCAKCAETVLHNVCPTCGGNFERRPIRPRQAWRENLKLGLEHHPADSRRRQSAWSVTDVAKLIVRLSGTPPQDR